jgi:hypothetical protein
MAVPSDTRAIICVQKLNSNLQIYYMQGVFKLTIRLAATAEFTSKKNQFDIFTLIFVLFFFTS